MLTMSTLIQFVSLIASFSVIGMNYHVYRMSHKHTLIDDNLEQIVALRDEYHLSSHCLTL